MATNRIIGDGQVNIVGPSGGLSAGDAYFVGGRFGVCPNDVAEAEVGYMETEGCWSLPFVGSTTASANDKAYWDPTAGKIYTAWAAGRVLCGTFYADAASADTTCEIMLDGGVVHETEEGDITGVTAGTGLTGGGSTGSVTLACDFGTASGEVCEGDDSRLSDARTPTAHAASHATGAADAIAPSDIGAMDLVATPTAGNLIEQSAGGNAVDSGLATADVQVLTVPTAADNIATLSAAGELQDSTVAIADVSALLDIAGDEVRKSTATPQTLGTGVAADIAFEVSEVAGDITVNVGNTEFTVPTTGMYAVDVSITFAGNADGTSRAVDVLVDGTASKISDDQSPDGVNPVTASEDGNLYLTAAQVVKIQGTQDSGGDLNVTAGRLMIKRIQ